MDLDAVGINGGIVILWKPNVVDIMDWWANLFVLIVEFQLLKLGTKGSLMNIYGPSAFPHKQAFLDFLGWVKGLIEIGNWVIEGDFNLISNLGEKKGDKWSLDKY